MMGNTSLAKLTVAPDGLCSTGCVAVSVEIGRLVNVSAGETIYSVEGEAGASVA